MSCHILVDMNEISFVIAPYDLQEMGLEPAICIEPVIDGVSLVDRLKWEDREVAYAGLADIAYALAAWRVPLDDPAPRKIDVLGDDNVIFGTSSAVSAIALGDGAAVTWADFYGSYRPGIHPDHARYESVGPFRFDRAAYERALQEPERAEAPPREAVDVDALASGDPDDPLEWLYAMTMAFDRDFLTPRQPDLVRTTTARGLRALAQRGTPVTEHMVRAWARERNFSAEAIDRYVEWFSSHSEA